MTLTEWLLIIVLIKDTVLWCVGIPLSYYWFIHKLKQHPIIGKMI